VSVRPPDLDAEQELDLGRLWGVVAARWWLPAAGLVVGAILGYLVALGGGATYKAQAIVFLGQPLSPSGNVQIQSLATNPSTVRQIVRSEINVRRVARAVGLPARRLRGTVGVTPISGAIARLGQTPLVAISVKGTPPAKIADAANRFAGIVVSGVSSYVGTKIGALQAQIGQDVVEETALRARIATINAALAKKGALSTTEQLIVSGQAAAAEQQLGITQQDESQARQLLSLARNVERSRIVTPAVPAKTSARSSRTSLVVGAFIGLILGVLAALLWAPLLRAARRPA
jgi:hypothetical protein